jgi:tetratricopeptide (TPR) repeat protein
MKTSLWTLLIPALLTTWSARADLVQKSAGRKPDARLKIKKSGVPQFDLTSLKKAKTVPRLDIGEEPVLSAGDVAPTALPGIKPLKMPEPVKRVHVPGIPTEKALRWAGPPAKAAKQFVDVTKPVNVPVYQAPLPVQDPTVLNPESRLVDVKDLSPVELKMLQALIFLEIQKNYPMALGLFAELLDEAPQYKTEATYQLALTAKGLGLYSEYKFQMMKVLEDKNLEWQKRAARSLAESAAEGDTGLVAVLDPKLEKFKIEPEKADQYQINRAKYYLEAGRLKEAIEATEKIAMDSPLYLDSQFLKGVLLYKGGELENGILTISSTLSELEKKKPDSELKTIAALTLARLQFQSGDYKASFQSYLKVDKSHPEWPQAMIEQAWAQILSGDFEGAAGNMFSLHTDFFKNTFAPESYIVRTVGYLNLCQYGDGARAIHDLKKRYTPIQEKMKAYKAGHKNELDYYETVKTFLTDGQAKEIDGLPRGLVWTLARHPSFIAEQKSINSLEDQISRYNKVTMDLISREKFLLSEQSAIHTKIAALQKNLKPGEKSTAVQDLEKRLMSFKVQHFIVKKARTSIKDIRSQGLARIEKEKARHRVAAAKALANRMSSLTATLANSLDQTDVLQYELYAGAGEHLRYQAAGGEIKPSEAKGLTPEEAKQLKWDFKGEVWEDELGHFRSSLKNVCPDSEKGSEQASVSDK